jgi:3',5'-cyclic AMP phosphodiesterase CpdA
MRIAHISDLHIIATPDAPESCGLTRFPAPAR